MWPFLDPVKPRPIEAVNYKTAVLNRRQTRYLTIMSLKQVLAKKYFHH